MSFRVIASEAKQSIYPRGERWIASAFAQSASADSKPGVACAASVDGSSLSLLAMTAGRPVRLNRLARIRHRCGEAAVDGDRLAVDVLRFVARQKQSHRRKLVRLSRALQRIELADLVLGAARLRVVEDRLGHA